MSVSSLLAYLKDQPDISRNIVYEKTIPPSRRKLVDPPKLHPALSDKLTKMGLAKVWSHQAEAITAALDKKNVIIATPTASGKTLCYNAPVINELLTDPSATAIALFPLKALGRDQYNTFTSLCEGLPMEPRAHLFDGDVKPYARKKVLADNPRMIFTNPDMLHLSMLPYHAKWEEFFKNLKYVVVDETHTYRGVFGSHIAQVFRRLLRIAKKYGANPLFICCSATISNPGSFATSLTTKKFTVVDKSGAPRPKGFFLFYNTEASPYTDSSMLMRTAIDAGLKTIVFTKARKITELIYTWTVQASPELTGRIANYRAGFLPSERREIERDLFTGKLDGVVTTSALEMGVDIGGLDVCVLTGYPGAIINTWQRSGRVGRGEKEYMVIMVAMRDALDQHFIRNPEDFFERGFESAVIDPDNETILKDHLQCAAAEMGIEQDDEFLTPNKRNKIFGELEKENLLLRSENGKRWIAKKRYPHLGVDIRNVGERYTIFGADGKTVIGSISGSKVFTEGHVGAVYLHKGRQYIVNKLDMEKKVIHVKPMEEKYYTRPKTEKETDILEILAEKEMNGYIIKLGRLKVTQQVVGYEKRSIFGQEALGTYKLDMPKTKFNTVGFWIEIGDDTRIEIEKRHMGFMGGIHAFEHVSIALFPLFALCDRDDVGGIAFEQHPGLGIPAVFFYDGYPDGVGLCEAVYAQVDKLWNTTLELIAGCDCENGCPSCIHSPKCGSGNKPLDKSAATAILMNVCGKSKRKKTLARITHATTTMDEEPVDKIIEDTNVEYYDPAPDKRICFFDLETQYSADQVGGWGNIKGMKLAVAVVYDSMEKKYIRYWEEDAGALVEKLRSADLVVGFNHIRFDYCVLIPYTNFNMERAIKNFDIMLDVWKRLGHRLSLNHLAEATLNHGKTADGLQSLIWWNEGKKEQVADYCQGDVRVTKELFEYGLENQKLIYTMKSGEKVQMALDWDLEKIIKEEAEKVKPVQRKLKF